MWDYLSCPHVLLLCWFNLCNEYLPSLSTFSYSYCRISDNMGMMVTGTGPNQTWTLIVFTSASASSYTASYFSFDLDSSDWDKGSGIITATA